MEDRYTDKFVVNDETGCWEWTAGRCAVGYGRYRIGKKKYGAHRVSYEAEYGPIPDGLVIDHLCRNRGCVNPAHLEAVTQRENVRRGMTGKHNSAKTHCPHGHEYSEENTYIRPRRSATSTAVTGGRHCRICMRATEKRYRERQSKLSRAKP